MTRLCSKDAINLLRRSGVEQGIAKEELLDRLKAGTIAAYGRRKSVRLQARSSGMIAKDAWAFAATEHERRWSWTAGTFYFGLDEEWLDVSFDQFAIERLAAELKQEEFPAVTQPGTPNSMLRNRGGRSSDKHGEPIASLTIHLLQLHQSEFGRVTGESLMQDLSNAYRAAGVAPPSDQNLLGICYGILRAVKLARAQ